MPRCHAHPQHRLPYGRGSLIHEAFTAATSPKRQRGAIPVFDPLYAHDEVLRIVGCFPAYNPSGVLTETRHYYFSDQWQIVREMVSGSTAALYIWGLRYVDELLVRYDPTYGRKYAMQDANFNCTAICDDASTGTVDERYQYDPYAGNRIILDSSWNVISTSAYNWTVGHQGTDVRGRGGPV